MAEFSTAKHFIGVEVNEKYVEKCRETLSLHRDVNASVNIVCASYFDFDWKSSLDNLGEDILIIGNPPWVTNSDLGQIASKNLPVKTNSFGLKGLDAVTGKANFDISEWMLLDQIGWITRSKGAIAVLCKTAVARKILYRCWKMNSALKNAFILRIDALKYFGASVDACLFYVESDSVKVETTCEVFDDFDTSKASRRLGIEDGYLVANIELFRTHRNLAAKSRRDLWRSGLKHDCSKVMELKITDQGLVNGFGEVVDIEQDYVYPFLKSSDIGNGRVTENRYCVIVTQGRIGDNTAKIETYAPKTWAYLNKYGEFLDARKSSIYRNKPRFSVFGIGDYSFAPWKIAISGFYKRLKFELVGPIGGKPTMLDDTNYFLSFNEQEEAREAHAFMTSPETLAFFESMIFWEDKRPITSDLLRRLEIGHLFVAESHSFRH